MNNTNLLPKTAVFVDYESWFWALYNKGEKPNVDDFMNKIKKQGKLEQLSFFGDFTKEEMAEEINKMRTVTNNIIDCSNKETKKEYTDFIMLDHIYRSVLGNQDIEQYILVTGDGHFHSIVAYLKNFKDKIVGVYGVEHSFSPQLRNCASWSEEFKAPRANDEYQTKVLQTINWAERQKTPVIIPTFRGTVEACTKYYSLEKTTVMATLRKFIEDGYIDQVIKDTPDGKEVRALVVKWDLLIKHGFWNPNSN